MSKKDSQSGNDDVNDGISGIGGESEEAWETVKNRKKSVKDQQNSKIGTNLKSESKSKPRRGSSSKSERSESQKNTNQRYRPKKPETKQNTLSNESRPKQINPTTLKTGAWKPKTNEENVTDEVVNGEAEQISVAIEDSLTEQNQMKEKSENGEKDGEYTQPNDVMTVGEVVSEKIGEKEERPEENGKADVEIKKGNHEQKQTEKEPQLKKPVKSWADLFPTPAPVKQNPQKSGDVGPTLLESIHKFNSLANSSEFGRGFVEFGQSRGLVNPHNKCFLNVILQLLIHSKPFYDFLKLIQNCQLSSNSILKKFVKFASDYVIEQKDSRRSAFCPEYFYPVLSLFSPNHKTAHVYQEDAQEFLSFLLDQMHEELVSVLPKEQKSATQEIVLSEEEEDEWVEVGKKNKTSVIITKEEVFTESPITKIFGGKLRSSIKRSQTRASVSIQPFYCIHLDIKHPNILTLEDAISWFCSTEDIEGYTDSKTKQEVKASKQTQFDKLPPFLIFHLKRFSFVEGAQKIHKPIDYPMNLTLPSSLLTHRVSSGQRFFKLFAVIFHLGPNATNGHYTCAIRINNTWFNFDDARVQSVQSETILNDPNAYLLIYQLTK